ncbi:hypothetical protein [Paenibacillus humicus]|uniref:hypothetical protein n=1 Tax=Paenibacillus humicus TaxID=412861 RepID=UPI000FDC682F|nr:hypothetical protein [Paenibacillus humicus]
MTKMPAKVQAAIDAYKAAGQKLGDVDQRLDERIAELTASINAMQAELDALIDSTLDDLDAATQPQETDLRRRIVDAQLALSAMTDRKGRAFRTVSGDQDRLAKAAVTIAKEEARKFFDAGHDDALSKVAEAKYAYLQAIVQYRAFRAAAGAIYYETLRETNPNLARDIDAPFFAEQSFEFRGGSPQIYGVDSTEVHNALKLGRIEAGSCAIGREVYGD